MLGTLRLSLRGSGQHHAALCTLESVRVCYVSALWLRGGFEDHAARALHAGRCWKISM